LKAFAAGFDAYRNDESKSPPSAELPRDLEDPRLRELLQRVRSDFPADIADVVAHGVRRMADYQDLAYAAEYLNRLAPVVALDKQLGVTGWRLARETARYLALWMTFEDTARVAELKLRASRFQRVGREVQLSQQQLMHINEYFHPRLQEIADMLPQGVGRWLMASSTPRALLERVTQQGRVVRTTSLTGFLMLYVVAGCRGFRRKSLRYVMENEAMQAWMSRVTRIARVDYALACEVVECQRLIKGYGDTHARGMSNYETIMSLVDGRTRITAEQVSELRDAALADESGQKLARALETQVSRHTEEACA
jgi:indolepyruvate ferredoxin oxidoreductase beta subunit